MISPDFAQIHTNGVTLRTAVAGRGPLVVLLHGFPQCWYLWRHQIDPLVEAGYRVAVPDQRGYGASSQPPAISDYNIRALAADVAGIAPALGYDEFVVVGHDWGCLVAWSAALLHRESCRAVLGLSVPYLPWNRVAQWVDPPGMDDRFWYIRYFQEPGVAEAELSRDLRASLLSIYTWASAQGSSLLKQLELPRASGLLDAMPHPTTLPPWLSEADLSYYIEQYEISGFRGPINWYRNIPTNGEITPELVEAKISQPAAFFAGAQDGVLGFAPDWRETMPPYFENLRWTELVEGAGHWVQMEKPAETNQLILRFLKEL